MRGSETAPLGTLSVRTPQLAWSYAFTPEDLEWTAKLIVWEAGGRDDADNAAVLWAIFTRYGLVRRRTYRTFTGFIRAHSTTLQPVLLNPHAAGT